MPRLINNISSESVQRHTLIFNDDEITLTLRYLAQIQQWFFDVEYRDFTIGGVKLAVGTLHMVSSNQPFDFAVNDNAGVGLDPFRADDFESGRCSLYLVTPEEMFQVRGVEVPE